MNREFCGTWAWVFAVVSSLALAACGGGARDGGAPQQASVSYPSGTQTFVIGTAITPVVPKTTGSLSSFTISPALPAGLAFDPGSGTISGLPTAISPAATYTVSASGRGESASTKVSIAVSDSPAFQIFYPAPSLTFSAGVLVPSQIPVPTRSGVVSWSISPALPSGLRFSTADGSISGTPTAPRASASYVVTAQSSVGAESTTTLTIMVDVPPLLNLGHQQPIDSVRASATRVLSIDQAAQWILWNYSDASIVASGDAQCSPFPDPCPFGPAIDMAGSTMAIVVATGFELRSTFDGHILASIASPPEPPIPAGAWWKLATDGSYIAVGTSQGMSVWSSSGQLLFSRTGNYSSGIVFAAPEQLQIGAGAAGQNVETIAVPAGTSVIGPSIEGQFASWFNDGSRFITLSGTTALIYSNASVQQGSIGSIPSGSLVGGVGNWVWIFSKGFNSELLTIYPAMGNNPAAAMTYPFVTAGTPIASGTTLAVLSGADSKSVSVIDLSGPTPSGIGYTMPIPMPVAAFAAVSGSQWMLGNQDGVLLDGTSAAGTPRYFGFGTTLSIAAGTNHFAVSTASGSILYFNSMTLKQEGQIPFFAGKVALSADGTVLIAQGDPHDGVSSLQVYSLPAGTLQYTWPYPILGSNTVPVGPIALSNSGTVLGQILAPVPGFNFELALGSPTGGSTIYSNSFNGNGFTPSVSISPDGNLAALTQSASPTFTNAAQAPLIDFIHNGVQTTAFFGVAVEWLDDSRLLVNNYGPSTFKNGPPLMYTGCTIYGADGTPSASACALIREFFVLQPVSIDLVYSPNELSIISVSQGTTSWTSGDVWRSNFGDPVVAYGGAVVGSHVILVVGNYLVAQTY